MLFMFLLIPTLFTITKYFRDQLIFWSQKYELVAEKSKSLIRFYSTINVFNVSTSTISKAAQEYLCTGGTFFSDVLENRNFWM